jgi:hypothetical protein
MDRSIYAGITASAFAIVFNLLVPLPFIPSVLVVISVIYVYGLASVKDGLLVAFMTYIFNDGIIGTIILTSLYLENKPYEVALDPYILLLQFFNPVTAAVAGYVGVKLVQKLKPATKETQPPSSFPPPPQPIPPV